MLTRKVTFNKDHAGLDVEVEAGYEADANLKFGVTDEAFDGNREMAKIEQSQGCSAAYKLGGYLEGGLDNQGGTSASIGGMAGVGAGCSVGTGLSIPIMG